MIAIALQPLKQEGLRVNLELTHCGAAHAARIAGLNGMQAWDILEVDESRGTSLGAFRC